MASGEKSIASKTFFYYKTVGLSFVTGVNLENQ
jgi:hypothetical protein